MGNKLTSILLGALAVVVLIFVFFYFRGNSNTESAGLTVESATGGSPIGAFLRQISAIRNVSLDSDVFNNPVLKNLKDQSKPIPSENKGRTNPFAPLGKQSASVSQVVAPVDVIVNAPVIIPAPVVPGPLSD
ncbi:MAG: hypothetical protein UR85_C0011G0018 [Candidatus Nomurabacteria bacterium GW2011_GWF2_35_66]|nr:MAG: hypothetical protein UR85_C0011G0018 [Candidatus Nomurabacteria bacterium GW2011_GWF2_35_66]HBM45424.1 hypothetical protein [Patescibacteria group bacterium]